MMAKLGVNQQSSLSCHHVVASADERSYPGFGILFDILD